MTKNKIMKCGTIAVIACKSSLINALLKTHAVKPQTNKNLIRCI